jgi:hypothetical protein
MMRGEIFMMAAIFLEYIFVAGRHTNSQSRGAPFAALLSLFKVGLTFVFQSIS